MNMIAVGLTLLQADLELSCHRNRCGFCRNGQECSIGSDLRASTTIDSAEAQVRWQDGCRKGVEQ